MKILIQILGPTGVGKSSMAVRVAKYFNGEVISADSMQIYKGFDIGTAKISISEREDVKHHLIDVLEDCSQFNVKKFLALSYVASENILKRGKLPIICGGTALYLRLMIDGIFEENDIKRVSRKKLKQISETSGLDLLYRRLFKIDSEYAEKIGENDEIRIVRGLEIFYNNGLTPTEIFSRSATPFKGYKFIRVGLTDKRERIYKRINERVDEMIKIGLIKETEELMKKYKIDCPPFNSIGYRESVAYIKGEITKDKCIELIKQRSRNFAKRQLSWFRHEKDIVWFGPDDTDEIIGFINKKIN